MRGTPIPAIMYDFWNQIIDFGSKIMMFEECSIVFGWLSKKQQENFKTNRIYIQGENVLQAELFDLRGRKVKATNQNQIDLSDITSGSFILKITTDNNNTKSFKIIKR